MGKWVSVAELLDGHVTLDVECFDRLYLNGYIPTLQTAGGTVYFLHNHRGHSIPSSAVQTDGRGLSGIGLRLRQHP